MITDRAVDGAGERGKGMLASSESGGSSRLLTGRLTLATDLPFWGESGVEEGRGLSVMHFMWHASQSSRAGSWYSSDVRRREAGERGRRAVQLMD